MAQSQDIQKMKSGSVSVVDISNKMNISHMSVYRSLYDRKNQRKYKKYHFSCCIFSLFLGFLMYGLCVFLSRCDRSDIVKVIPSTILGIIASYIAYQQHKISKSQKEISEDKHRLELFEKRFETYELFLDMALKSRKLSPDRRSYQHSKKTINEREENVKYMKFVRDNESKMISLGEGAIFLFGPEVKSILNQAQGTILSKVSYVEALNELRGNDVDTKNFIDEITNKTDEEKGFEQGISSYDKILSEFYEKKLPEITGPYLRMSSYISKD